VIPRPAQGGQGGGGGGIEGKEAARVHPAGMSSNRPHCWVC
jgi:hypothetical protein